MAPPKKKPTKRRKKATAASRGLSPAEIGAADLPESLQTLRDQVKGDGGLVLSVYRDPLGGHWQCLAALPIEQVKPTPFQRNISDTHVKRLAEKIDRLDRFLDPIIAVRVGEGAYETPNGFHRLGALNRLGARSITALIVPDPDIAFQILALNTEKAHNVREKAIEAIRMERELTRIAPAESEATYAPEFEEAPFLTLGVCYERNGRFSGGAYYSVLRKTDDFFEEKMPRALALREKRADQLFELDDLVTKAVDRLKENGLQSPFLKTFVVARINPLRWKRGATADFDETYGRMLDGIKKFDTSRIQAHHLAGMAGGAPEEG